MDRDPRLAERAIEIAEAARQVARMGDSEILAAATVYIVLAELAARTRLHPVDDRDFLA